MSDDVLGGFCEKKVCDILARLTPMALSSTNVIGIFQTRIYIANQSSKSNKNLHKTDTYFF